jgi:hypothetical protein
VTFDFDELVRRAILDARATLVDPTTDLWLDPELGISEPVCGPAALALLVVDDVDAAGHTSRPLATAAPRVWGISRGPIVFREEMARGARLERVYGPDALLTFENDPLPGWRVREVIAGVSAKDLQRRAPFGLVAGPDLRPLRAEGHSSEESSG